MLTYDMEERNGQPMYDYLCGRIRADILSGALPAGMRLPSKRALAEHLKVSVITVEGAYQQLEAEGYLTARPRRGFFVERAAGRVPEPPPSPALPPEPPEPVWRLDLRNSRLDGGLFPTAAWTRLTRRVLSEGEILAPAPHQGMWPLRQAIAGNLRALRGMAVSPEQIVVGAGAEYLYLLLAQLMGREAVFALEDPGYPKIRQVYGKWGAVCRPVPLDGQGVPPEELEAAGATVLHISPAHHYPTGIVTPIARRQALLRWAERSGGVIIEDDYDSELRFTGRPIPTLQSIDAGERVVYMSTFSQTISPSMRVGFMVLPPWLMERCRRELGFYACTVPVLEQQVLARFLSEGWYERHLSRLRKEYRTRRAAVLKAFSTAFAGRAAIFERGTGLHFLLRLDTEKSDQALRQRAESLGVRLGFLSEYAAVQRPEYAHTLVVNYARLDADRLDETVSLLEEIIWKEDGETAGR